MNVDSKELWNYSSKLIDSIPQSVYEGLASVFCVGTVIFIVWKGFKIGIRYSAALLLIEYIFLIYSSTVIFRVASKVRKYDLLPFKSFMTTQDGEIMLPPESIMNVAVFVPFGLLLNIVCKRIKWWIVLLLGCCFSVTIEVLQFGFMKGFATTDDVIHNTLGCLVGYVLLHCKNLWNKCNL